MASDSPVVIVDAVRTPIGRRGGGLSSVHPAEQLGGMDAREAATTATDRRANNVDDDDGRITGHGREPTQRRWPSRHPVPPVP